MTPLQILTLVATCLGIAATVFNLVAFVREKDRGHLRAGLLVLALLGVFLLVALMPTLAPGPAGALLKRLPPPAAQALQGWLAPASPTQAFSTAASTPEAPSHPPAPSLQGSAHVEIRRNVLGGIGSLVAVFQFADLSGRGARVTAYTFGVQEEQGGPTFRAERVLPQAVEVPPGGTARAEVELDPEIGDRWLARRDNELAGSLEVTWRGADAAGNPLEFEWADRVEGPEPSP